MLARYLGLIALVCGLAAPVLAQAPPKAGQMLTRIAFGSCANQQVQQPIWDAVRAYKPDLFLFAGDNVYGDLVDGKLVRDDAVLIDTLTRAYLRGSALTRMSDLRRQVPHLATWDDHDFGKNDAGADFVHRDAAQKLFVEFWKLPADDPRRSRAGVYHAHVSGPAGKRVQIILLDTRYFRSPLKTSLLTLARGQGPYEPDDTPDKTMLGPAQWTWLEEQLKVPADLRLIVSSIQLTVDGHNFERWGNLPRERQRFYDLIRSTGAGNVLLLSGDRHFGALFRQTEGVPYPLYEITSSGLTQTYPGVSETNPNRLGPPYGAVNFGTIDIDWWAASVTLSLRGMNGEPVRRQTIALSEIAARKP